MTTAFDERESYPRKCAATPSQPARLLSCRWRWRVIGQVITPRSRRTAHLQSTLSRPFADERQRTLLRTTPVGSSPRCGLPQDHRVGVVSSVPSIAGVLFRQNICVPLHGTCRKRRSSKPAPPVSVRSPSVPMPRLQPACLWLCRSATATTCPLLRRPIRLSTGAGRSLRQRAPPPGSLRVFSTS